MLLVRFITYWSFLAFSGLVTFGAGFGELLQRARTDATSLTPPAGSADA